MSDQQDQEANTTAAAAGGIGPQLRAAREKKGLTLDQIAAETRISRSHLEHIEAGSCDRLAGRTYAVGFARTYAKTVGLNEDDVVAMVRSEMNVERERENRAAMAGSSFEPGDPARAPGGKLVWFSLFAIVLLLVGIFFAARVLFSPAAELPSLTEQQAAEERAAQQARADAAAEAEEPVDEGGEVVFTAEGEAWVRFYDENGRVLTEQTLQEGDSYTIPADAVGPQIITGRPDLLAITVGGRSVPKLSEELETLTDVPVSAAALAARGAPPAGEAPEADSATPDAGE